MTSTTSRRSAALTTLCLAQLAFILDISVVNVALVPLARELDAGPEQLSLVAALYTASFGGVLLVSSRVVDQGWVRATFLVGIIVFAVASVLCGLAWDLGALLIGRAAQGLGAGLASPAALALVTLLYAEGAERNRALGAWAAVAAAGGAIGLLLGGVLTELLGWRSVFFINLPIAAIIVAGAYVAIPADDALRRPSVPWSRGALVVAAALLLVLGLGSVAEGRYDTAVPLLAAGVGAAIAFVVLDRRSRAPMLPAEVVKSRSVRSANATAMLLSAVVLGMNFFLALRFQDRLGFGAFETGLAFLPVTVAAAAASLVSARLVPRFGARALLVAGQVVMTSGCLAAAIAPPDSYALGLPGLVGISTGMGIGFTVTAIAATAGVRSGLLGAAAGLLSVSTQLGAAVGLALITVAVALVPHGRDPVQAAFGVMTLLAAASVLTALGRPVARGTTSAPLPQPPAHAAACLPGCAVDSAASVPRP